MQKYLNNNLLLLNVKKRKICTLSQGTGYLQNFAVNNIEVGKFKTGKKFKLMYYSHF